jgi:hypothetical protein
MIGFIITRHVTNAINGQYWVECVRAIKMFYPSSMIVIIDDASSLACPPCPYDNVVVLQSEFPKRGELLPYYYFTKHRWFDKAVILHDSVFLQTFIDFDAYEDQPLWHFVNSHPIHRVHFLAARLKTDMSPSVHFKMTGCFGLMGVVNLSTVDAWQAKYGWQNLLRLVSTRNDRCACERIFGLFFEKPSIFGNIMKYQFGLKFDDYKRGKNSCKFIVKVWSGR